MSFRTLGTASGVGGVGGWGWRGSGVEGRVGGCQARSVLIWAERAWCLPWEPQRAQAMRAIPLVMAAPLFTNKNPSRKTVKLFAPGLTDMIV